MEASFLAELYIIPIKGNFDASRGKERTRLGYSAGGHQSIGNLSELLHDRSFAALRMTKRVPKSVGQTGTAGHA
jgi:hypothetical protein